MAGFPSVSRVACVRFGVMVGESRYDSKSGCLVEPFTAKLMKSRKVTKRLSCAGGLFTDWVHA